MMTAMDTRKAGAMTDVLEAGDVSMIDGRGAGKARRKTKIVATLGPASRDERTLAGMARAGMNVARVNLSHGSTDEHEAAIAAVRRVAADCGSPLAVLIDLPGPKLRVGELSEPVVLRAGQSVTLGASADSELPVNFPELLGYFRPGELVLVDDGAVALRVSDVSHDCVTLEALNDGTVESHKGVNLPDTSLPIAALTAADRRLLAWGLTQDVDYVALSFVRSADDVRELKQEIAAAGGDQLVVAKIEKKEALAVYEEIVAAADAVMVARGDLGVEVDPATVPIWQKRIIHAANVAGKPVITATQMLQSMIAVPATDTGRGKRCRQRHLRRDERRHAVRRDGDRPLSGRGGRDDGRDRLGRGGGYRARGSRAAPVGEEPFRRVRGDQLRRLRGSRTRRRGGHRERHLQRRHGARRGAQPAEPADRGDQPPPARRQPARPLLGRLSTARR